ncbi:MAG TPA: glycosyltransferase family 4 protein [Gaiellaceae bacterium]|nr:glycosyltransferase family 4 protein [Gaiellaceae bacterium]
MKVVHLIDRDDAVGGVQTYVAQLVPGLAARGIESEVVVGASIPGLLTDGPAPPREALAALDERIAELRPDCCYLHGPLNPGVALSLAAHAPTLGYAHDYAMVCPGNARFLVNSGSFCAEGPGLRCFRRAYTERSTNRRPDRVLRAYRRVRSWPDAWQALARILVASPFVAGVLERDGAPRDRIRVVAYPIAPAAPAEPERLADVLYVGRLVSSKGVGVLLRAAAEAGASVAVAGDGPDRPGLETLAAELGADVRFLGWVTPERRASLLRGARVFAMPSLWEEPFGIAGVEALAAGVPVVASEVGGIPSWLEDGRGGLLVPPDDVAALRDALRRVLEEPGLAERLAVVGPGAAARFSLDAHLDLLVPELEAVA